MIVSEAKRKAMQNALNETPSRKWIPLKKSGGWWRNDCYQVFVQSLEFNGKPGIRIDAGRIDGRVIWDYRDLQRIKNDILGEEAEAVMLFPAESRQIDDANVYVLLAPIDRQRIPVGSDVERHVTGDSSMPQRNFSER